MLPDWKSEVLTDIAAVWSEELGMGQMKKSKKSSSSFARRTHP